MRRSNTQHLSNILKVFVDEHKFNNKLTEVDMVNYCHQMMGKTLSRYISNIYVARQTLFVEVNSSVAKSELMMYRENILSHIVEKFGEEIVNKVVIK